MKSLQQLINEKLKISKKDKKIIVVEDDKELHEIIRKRYQDNQKYLDLSDIDVSKVKSFSVLFQYLYVEHVNLSGWNTSNGENFYAMFSNCGNLKEINGLEDFDVSNATDISSMFNNCFALEGIEDQLSDWDVSKVSQFSYTFFSCSKLKNFKFLQNWDMSNAVSVEAMLANTKIDSTEYVNNWNLAKLDNCNHLFSHCNNLKDADLTGWKNVSNIKETIGLFKSCKNLQSLNLANLNLIPTNISFICDGCESLKKVNISGLDTSKLTTISYSFRDCEDLVEIVGIEQWDVKKVINAYHTFEGCKSLVADLSSWKLQHNVNNTKMFYKASRKIKKAKINI